MDLGKFNPRSYRNFVGALAVAAATAQAKALPPEPPQYVVLAFDGSKNNQMWEETRAFARDNDIKFTYFMNSVYFLENNRHNEYQPPHNISRGASAIGFGGQTSDVQTRIHNVNSAYEEKNEIACHASGHFDGSNWSTEDWDHEFSQFFHIMFDLNAGWKFLKSTYAGFRAPQLGISNQLWPALRNANFRYDTSQTADPTDWPQKSKYGFWEFPLAEIRMAGSARKTLSMDYNFFYAQSPLKNGEPVDQPEHAAEYSKQMYDSYMNYFLTNYKGNRAPINIGHHFSKWNGGAYWDAMQKFSKTVCHLPNVKCVTYSELADFMDSLDAETLSHYRRSEFQKGAIPRAIPVLAAQTVPGIDFDFQPWTDGRKLKQVVLSGEDRAKLKAEGLQIHKQVIRDVDNPDTAKIEYTAVVDDKEILKKTYPAIYGDGGLWEISGPHLEASALLGDMPQAHEHDDDGDIEAFGPGTLELNSPQN